MVPSLWARVLRQPMKFNLKQGSRAVAGELSFDEMRTRTSLWARVVRQQMKFNLKQGLGAVAGDLLVDEVRTRTAMYCIAIYPQQSSGRKFIRRVETEVCSAPLVILFGGCERKFIRRDCFFFRSRSNS